jgi:hypothetical protein
MASARALVYRHYEGRTMRLFLRGLLLANVAADTFRDGSHGRNAAAYGRIALTLLSGLALITARTAAEAA